MVEGAFGLREALGALSPSALGRDARRGERCRQPFRGRRRLADAGSMETRGIGWAAVAHGAAETAAIGAVISGAGPEATSGLWVAALEPVDVTAAASAAASTPSKATFGSSNKPAPPFGARS